LFSSFRSDFNRDFWVEFTKDERKQPGYKGERYNFGTGWGVDGDVQMPGISVFRKGMDGKIYHTYSAHGRSIDIVNCCHHVFDMLPFGRDGFMDAHPEKYDWRE